MDLKKHIRSIPDFPKAGICFYDIAPLLRNGEMWQNTVDQLAARLESERPDQLLGIESRGFMVAAALSYRLGCGFAMIREKNKLPGTVRAQDYQLEYGTDRIEMQEDALKHGQRVVIVDDLLATGGTLAAAITLARGFGAIVTLTASIIELRFLNGRAKLDAPHFSLLSYDA